MDEPQPFHPQSSPIEDPYPLCGIQHEKLAPWDRHVVVDVVHDGTLVPPILEPYFNGDGGLSSEMKDAFVRERDWGAAAVAERLAYHLGLRGYHNVAAARVVCDYNRFRGRSVPEAGHLGRRALFAPGSDLLSDELGECVLADCYDPITRAVHARVAEAFENTRVADSRLIRITVHTYDDRAGAGNRRPKTSLIFTPFEYHETARIPANVYPPVFAERLAEFTADRALAYRIALALEKNYLPVAMNSPYFLPLGGAEMRLQVWCYMQHLREEVERLDPGPLARRLEPLWPVLNQVDTPWGRREIDPDMLALLAELETFVERNHIESVERYRYSAYRPSAIEVEVRKDVVWHGRWETLADGGEAYVPDEGGLREDEIDRAAAAIADGIRKYLTLDQPEKRSGAPRP